MIYTVRGHNLQIVEIILIYLIILDAMQTVLTVSQLNRNAKKVLEEGLHIVSVTGEISNLARPKSGHLYFTLKDAYAQVRCVYFRNYHQHTSAALKDGQQINIQANVSLYEARGEYQLNVFHVSDAGQGALLRQFQMLKEKLQKEGLFDSRYKKSLPSLPHTIAIISSPSGAALQDILTTLRRRFPFAQVLIYPSEVQGALAHGSLQKALAQAMRNPAIDVLILARGGGSIEDLQAFNNETLARQIHQSPFPVVTGIGHETDFTIADFVADLRAPTPTAAAEAATPDIRDMAQHLHKDEQRLLQAMRHILQRKKQALHYYCQQLKLPYQIIHTAWQRLDRCQLALAREIKTLFHTRQHQIDLLKHKLAYQSPLKKLQELQYRTENVHKNLYTAMQNTIAQSRQRFRIASSTLHALSPLATLDRGYSLTTFKDKVLYSADDVHPQDHIKVRLKKGALFCEVIDKMELNHDEK